VENNTTRVRKTCS